MHLDLLLEAIETNPSSLVENWLGGSAERGFQTSTVLFCKFRNWSKTILSVLFIECAQTFSRPLSLVEVRSVLSVLGCYSLVLMLASTVRTIVSTL